MDSVLDALLKWLRFILFGWKQMAALQVKLSLAEADIRLLQSVVARQSMKSDEPVFLRETDFAAFEKHIHQELAEIREKLETKARRGPSGKPFTTLRAIAEAGEARAVHGR